MWPAFPTSDYYGGSASLHIIGGTLPWHLCKPSPVHMLDLNRMGEVACRSLYPCLPQVVANTTV